MGIDMGELFPRLMAAHAIGDFALQTNWVFQYKVTRPWGVVLHVAIVSACTFLLLTPYLHDGRVVGLTVILMLIHLFQDKLKIEKQRDESRNNMWSFLSDQFLHILFMLLMSLVVIRFQPVIQWPWAAPDWLDGWYREDRWMWMITWYFLGTFGCHILIGYLRKSFAANHEFVLDTPALKYAGFMERAGIGTGFWMALTIHPFYGLVALAAAFPKWRKCLREGKGWQDFAFSAVLGVLLGVFLFLS